MNVLNNIEQLIGNTPLYEVVNIEKKFDLKARLFVKLEYFNPAGSVKDRTALFMLNDAEKKGLIKENATIIEPTSGNTGIGLASICASRGYKAIFTMPDTMSEERIKLLKAYGAKVILTDGKYGMAGAIEKAKQLNDEIPNSFIPSQFDNPANIEAHYCTTAQEIWSALDGKIDIFVAGVGTGGTLSGCAKFFKEKSQIKIVGVEPQNSPMLSKGKFASHKIQGIGANFVPKNFYREFCDEIITISDESAIESAKLLAKNEGLLVGISSGASLGVAIELAKQEKYNDKNIVVILPDTGERYLSTDLFDDK